MRALVGLLALLLGAASWGVVMRVTYDLGHPGWVIIQGVFGACALVAVASECLDL